MEKSWAVNPLVGHFCRGYFKRFWIPCRENQRCVSPYVPRSGHVGDVAAANPWRIKLPACIRSVNGFGHRGNHRFLASFAPPGGMAQFLPRVADFFSACSGGVFLFFAKRLRGGSHTGRSDARYDELLVLTVPLGSTCLSSCTPSHP